MKKWVWLTLLAIILLAVLIRLMPLTEYAIWGSDTGEYYYISNYIAEEQTIPEDYEGWGFGYPYFPGMFYLTVTVSEAANLDLFYTLLILTPLLSALSVAVVYLITRRIGGSEHASLIAAAVLAVAMPHVITTSHPMPGSLGDLFYLACILLLLQCYKDKRYFPLLLLGTFSLIMIHHLSTLILIVTVVGIVIMREIMKRPDAPPERVRMELAYIFFLLTGTVAYWFFAAPPFWDKVLLRNFGSVSTTTFFLMVYIGFGVLVGIAYLARTRLRYRYDPPRFPAKRQWIIYIVFLISSLSFVIITTKVPIPPMETTPAPAILLNIMPLFVLMTFITFGPNESEIEKEGIFVIAWLTIVSFTALGSVIIGSKELIIYRFFQYFAAPWAIFIGLGFYAAYRMLMEIKFAGTDEKAARPHTRAGFMVALLFTILVLSAGVTAYPDKSSMANFQEGITHEEMDGVYWCRDNLEDDATLASDHRLSSMVFGFGGVNASWDYVVDVFYEDTFEGARDELNESSLPSGKKRIDYIMLSDELKEGVALFQNREAAPMSEAAIAKFEKDPFYKIYESNGVEVFLIDWSYAE